MDGKVIIGTELDTKSFEEQIMQTEEKLNRLEKAYEKALKSTGKFKPNEQAMANLRKEIEKTRNSLIDLKAKQENLKGDYGSVGNSLKDIVNKVTKWGLAVFGIRSAYSAIRSAMNSIASENEQIATDIEYMRWILAQTLKPVVEWIIKGLYLVLTLINMISKALFRYDILSGKGADNFKQAQKNSAGITKNLREANKQLAGFDEMNVLNDNSSSGAGGNVGLLSGDWAMPDFTSFEQQIQNLKNKWFEFGEEMKKSLYNMPFSVWTNGFGQWDLAVFGVTQTVHGLWGMITKFVEFFKGIVEIIYGLITGNTETIKKGFYDLFSGLWGWVKATAETISGVGNTIKGVIKGIIQTVWGWLFDFINRGIEKFNEFKDKVTEVWTKIRDNIKNKIREIQNFLTEKFGVVGTVIGDVIGSGIKNVINAILGWAESKINGFFGSINSAISVVNKIPGVEIKKITAVHFPRLAKGGIINMPGRGVPVGSAIGGERGAEGVIPLTDSQQMALLGEAIGKYININTTIPVYVGNRQIAREIRKINAEDDFAYNGG